MDLSIRADVLDAITQELHSTGSLVEVIEDIAYWEASARKRFAGSDVSDDLPIDCEMTGPLAAVTFDLPEPPVRMLRDSMRPGETLDGLITALLIAEVRHRRTSMHWQVLSADEPIMTEDTTLIAALMHHDHAAITTTTEGHLMYTITTEVSEDLLAAFDATLDAWEDRSEELVALIHLEDEVRACGATLASTSAASSTEADTVTIDLRLDPHDYATLERILGDGGEAEHLLTALMVGALGGAPGFDEAVATTSVTRPQ